MRRRTLVGLAGVLLALVLWVLIVPWDLSEVDKQGQVIDSGDDERATRISLVLMGATAVAMALLVMARARYSPSTLLAGSSAAWVTLFAWRSVVARTTGANMFVVPLLFVVLPVAVTLPLLVRRWERKVTSQEADQ